MPHERHLLSHRQGAQIDGNTNILNNSTLLGTLGFTAAQITGITNDCTLLVYLLTSVGEMADSTYRGSSPPRSRPTTTRTPSGGHCAWSRS